MLSAPATPPASKGTPPRKGNSECPTTPTRPYTQTRQIRSHSETRASRQGGSWSTGRTVRRAGTNRPAGSEAGTRARTSPACDKETNENRIKRPVGRPQQPLPILSNRRSLNLYIWPDRVSPIAAVSRICAPNGTRERIDLDVMDAANVAAAAEFPRRLHLGAFLPLEVHLLQLC